MNYDKIISLVGKKIKETCVENSGIMLCKWLTTIHPIKKKFYLRWNTEPESTILFFTTQTYKIKLESIFTLVRHMWSTIFHFVNFLS